MARIIRGFVYGPKRTRDEVEGATVEMILGVEGAKAVDLKMPIDLSEEHTLEYALFEFPGGSCFFEKYSSIDQLMLTLCFFGPQFYEEKGSLAGRIRKYFEDKDVRIDKDRIV